MSESEIVRIYSRPSSESSKVAGCNTANKSYMISMADLMYVLVYIGSKNSTASIEAPLAEELVNKSSTVNVLELG